MKTITLSTCLFLLLLVVLSNNTQAQTNENYNLIENETDSKEQIPSGGTINRINLPTDKCRETIEKNGEVFFSASEKGNCMVQFRTKSLQRQITSNISEELEITLTFEDDPDKKDDSKKESGNGTYWFPQKCSLRVIVTDRRGNSISHVEVKIKDGDGNSPTLLTDVSGKVFFKQLKCGEISIVSINNKRLTEKVVASEGGGTVTKPIGMSNR